MSSSLVLIGISLFIAGAVKGVFGMGLPAISLGLLVVWMSPVEAAAIIVIPTLVTNAWQFFTGPGRLAMTRRFAMLLVGVAVGTAIGIGFLTGSHRALVSLALGGVLLAYAMVGLLAPRIHVPVSWETWASPLIGLVTGTINGATGVSVMPLVPYLNSLGLNRDELIQAMGLIFMSAMLSLATCLVWTGDFKVASATASVLALIPVFAGMCAGQAIRLRLHADAFRKWFFIGLIALGGYTALRAILQIVR